MLKLIELVRAKPKDKTIRTIRGIYALIFLTIFFGGYQYTTFEVFGLPRETLLVLLVFPLLSLVRSVVDPGMFRRRIWKYITIANGVLFILSSWFLIDTETHPEAASTPVVTVSGEVSATSIVSTTDAPFVIDTDHWVGFFGWILLFLGLVLNSKNITTKNERHGEKVKKIRI